VRVVQFAGWSKTGKTGLIEEVLRAAPPAMVVGVIKHLGGAHPFELEPGRDTTRFYEQGARAVIGIDREKGVTLFRDDSLEAALDRLSDAGCDVALVEGFKTVPFARVVIGDLPSDRAVLRNPAPEEVITALDRFDEHHSPQGLLRVCRRESGAAGGVECTCAAPVDPALATDQAALAALEGRCATLPGVTCARVHGRVYAQRGTMVLALIARDPAGAAAALAVFDAAVAVRREPGGRG